MTPPKPRWYQAEAIAAAIKFFESPTGGHGFEILPTGSGKSVVIANIAKELSGKTVVFQPSKEILEQNYAKFTAYGFRASIYSASLGQKYIDQVTFATIGSVAKKHHLFRQFDNIIVDEAHLINPDDGMYRDFINSISHAKVLGLTATPYRLTSEAEGSMLKFLNRTTPKIFDECLYYVQNDVLFNEGHLAPLEYYDFNSIDRTRLEINAKGTDFTEASMRAYIRQNNIHEKTAMYANALLQKRKNLLVFCTLLDEANKVARLVPGSVVLSGDTDASLRAKILAQFKAGTIRCVINCGVLTTGFDFPGLDTVLNSRSTMSLSLYYQILGRVIRPYTYPDGTKKTGWYVDLGGNIQKFGKVETMQIRTNSRGEMSIWNNGKQLTNVVFTAAA